MKTLRSKMHGRAFLLSLAALSSAVTAIVVGPASPAHADPACTNGVYTVFARGTGEHLNDKRAHQFYWSIKAVVEAAPGGVSFVWSELGNEDGDVPVDMSVDPRYLNGGAPHPNAENEYPATGAMVGTNPPEVVMYANSVTIGTNELIAHLNNRVARCPQESIVLGGFSQGADLVGWALQRTGYGSLNQTTRNHIGFVALYGDPKFNPGGLAQRQQWQRPSWVRGDDPGFRYRGSGVISDAGLFGYRDAYVAPEFNGRFGSWCAYRDGICTGSVADNGDWGTHGSAYDGYWIDQSAAEIANKAIAMRNNLNPSLLPATGPSYSIPGPDPVANPPITTSPPPPLTILQVKRSLAPDGTTHEVYAATNSTVTEAWWQPGGDGVHTDEIIHIAQNNIVGIDKVNMPDGVTQAVYTAVPDGVWETWWNANHSPTSAKIVTGLSGVRQAIVANAYEGTQFVHRLYLLAQDGPYEAWWKDGGDGVHVDRLNNISGGVAMAAGTGPDGAYEVFVATPTWVYQLWWFPGGAVNYRSVINITQGDIRSLSMGANLNGGQLLYAGTSTTAWQSWWLGDNGGISTGTIATGQTNAIQVEKDVYNGVHELYLATANHVQEYWWNGPNSGGGELIRISQGNITSFDKSDDGAYQQIYTASGNLVYETYWGAGVSPTSNVLFSVAQ